VPKTDVPLIPQAVLFGNAAHLRPVISPDGTRLFYLAPDDGVLNVWTAPIGRPQEARPLTRDRGRGIQTFAACHDNRTLCYRRDEDGDENWRLYLHDLQTGRERCVTPFTGVQARLLAHNRWHPDTMLIGLNKDRPALHDVYRLTLPDGELVPVAVNPGYLSWLIDSELRIRGGTVTRPDGGLAVHLAAPGVAQTPSQAPWLEVPYEDRAGTVIVGFSREGTTLHVLSSAGTDTSRLIAIDVATRQQTTLAGDPDYDISRVVLDPAGNTPQAVVVARDRDHWMFLDESFGTDVKQIRAELDRLGLDGELFIDRSERSGQLWIVCAVLPEGPARYYIYHQAEGRLEFLFSHLPELERYRLSRMEPFTFRARDGVTVHGYVTWPPGADRRGLPAVVNVHGGPWARHSFDLNEEGQWLANRGYACIQVNFRGSTGYGKRFRNLGAKEWGAAMHTDLLDAVAHLAADGAIDTSRVAIMGCSYGGYAALVGAAFTPDTFRCAVDLCGPANLLTLLAQGAPYRSPMLSFMFANVGNPETERDMLWDRSPLSRIDDIRIPILVAQGANDVRVTRNEAEQIVAALKAKGLPHEYLLFPDEGHGLMKAENREIYYAAVERFLAEHLVAGAVPGTSRP
jgi:dipeptidyl aminopeptidase/acylaminoacyl peptidase